MELPRSPDSPARARRLVRARLGRGGTASAAELLVSELVTNALLHTDSEPIEVSIEVGEGAVRVEVVDADPTRPELVSPGPEDEHGRGLTLVDALAQRWGVEDRAGGDGKVVWFELPC